MKALRQVLAEYREKKWAIPAFNIDCEEIYRGIEAAVAETKLPCIVQLSEGEDKFVGGEKLKSWVDEARAKGRKIYVNADHGQDQNRLLELVDLGFDMVHFDGSQKDYENNLITSKEFVQKVINRPNPSLIELEFNRLKEGDATEPKQALEFVGASRADLLAVSIGNRHGVGEEKPLDLNRLAEIVRVIPKTFLTLHGGSGIAAGQIREAIKRGIVKININTDLRLKFKEEMAKMLQQTDKIYEQMLQVISGVAQVAKEKLREFANYG